jgi:hypothetical protein
MDTLKHTNAINIKNKTEQLLTVIVEYMHYVEEVPPNTEFSIVIKSGSEINIYSFFDIEYQGDIIVVLLNNKIELSGKYHLSFLIDNKCLYSDIL